MLGHVGLDIPLQFRFGLPEPARRYLISRAGGPFCRGCREWRTGRSAICLGAGIVLGGQLRPGIHLGGRLGPELHLWGRLSPGIHLWSRLDPNVHLGSRLSPCILPGGRLRPGISEYLGGGRLSLAIRSVAILAADRTFLGVGGIRSVRIFLVAYHDITFPLP